MVDQRRPVDVASEFLLKKEKQPCLTADPGPSTASGAFIICAGNPFFNHDLKRKGFLLPFFRPMPVSGERNRNLSSDKPAGCPLK